MEELEQERRRWLSEAEMRKEERIRSLVGKTEDAAKAINMERCKQAYRDYYIRTGVFPYTPGACVHRVWDDVGEDSRIAETITARMSGKFSVYSECTESKPGVGCKRVMHTIHVEPEAFFH